MKKLEDYVRSIPDFPEPGIIFRDVTSILQDADGLQLAVDSLRAMVKELDYVRRAGGLCGAQEFCAGAQKGQAALRDYFRRV